MRGKPIVLIGLLAALGVACSSVRTNYDFDPGTDFSSWRSYDRVTQRVNEAVDEILGQFPPK